jgi:S1-C subfamily serine protease
MKADEKSFSLKGLVAILVVCGLAAGGFIFAVLCLKCDVEGLGREFRVSQANRQYEIVRICEQLEILRNKNSGIRQQMLNEAMKSVVHICVDSPMGSWQGSGSYVGDGLILTAGHVVEGATSFRCTFNDGLVIDSTKSFQCQDFDAGFIYIGDDVNEPALEFDLTPVLVGDDVYCLGNPYGWPLRFTATFGMVSAVGRDMDGFFGSKLMYQADFAAYPGNSGGPVLNPSGQIVGILVGGFANADCISLCVPSEPMDASRLVYLAMLYVESIK